MVDCLDSGGASLFAIFNDPPHPPPFSPERFIMAYAISGVIVVLLIWVTAIDLKKGEYPLPRKPRRKRQYIRRSEYPVVFFLLLFVRALAAAVLILIIGGWFMPLIQWSI